MLDLGQNSNKCCPDLGQFCIIVFVYLLSWLPCGLPMVASGPNLANRCGSPKFYIVCGPEQGVRSGPEVKSMWPRFG